MGIKFEILSPSKTEPSVSNLRSRKKFASLVHTCTCENLCRAVVSRVLDRFSSGDRGGAERLRWVDVQDRDVERRFDRHDVGGERCPVVRQPDLDVVEEPGASGFEEGPVGREEEAVRLAFFIRSLAISG